jgi:phosphoribosylamine--glycine ligase
MDRLEVYPGNAGIPEHNRIRITKTTGQAVDIADPDDLSELVNYIKTKKYDFVAVGPEQPLVNGITDALEGICLVFGPSRYAAQMEGSKKFAKDFMIRHNIPTALAQSFTNSIAAIEYLKSKKSPYVIKADGLAAGKGVTVTSDLNEAIEAVKDALDRGRFGNSGSLVVIEDFLHGKEASVFALCDGEKAIPFIAARDYKRVFDNDEGPNTGGMGAFTPVPEILNNPEVMRIVQEKVLNPVIAGMKAEGHSYKGLLYAGLMVDVSENSANGSLGNGEWGIHKAEIHKSVVNVVEFNVRFGDPETQALMRLLDEDLLDLMIRCAEGRLEDRPLRFFPGAAIVLVAAAEGYPDTYTMNIPLVNLPQATGKENPEDIVVFHAGTKTENGKLLSSGGRVLGITAAGNTHEEARQRVYHFAESMDSVKDGIFFRRDVARGIK